MMGPDRARVLEGVEIVLVSLGSLMVGEKVCIVTDDRTHTVGDLFRQRAEDEGAQPFHHNIEPLVMHGQEPPREVARCMKDSDLIIGLTTRSMAHTRARKESSERGARYLSLPEYSMELLAHSCFVSTSDAPRPQPMCSPPGSPAPDVFESEPKRVPTSRSMPTAGPVTSVQAT